MGDPHLEFIGGPGRHLVMCGRKPRGARWLGLLSRAGAGPLVAHLVVGPYSEGMDPRIHFSAESLAKIKERMSSSEPDTPRPSATVILLRDGARGPEAYLQKRQSSMVFGGRPVFPGGKVDAADSAEIDAWHGPSPEEWAQRLGVSADEARGLLLSLIHISEPTRRHHVSRMPSSA